MSRHSGVLTPQHAAHVYGRAAAAGAATGVAAGLGTGAAAAAAAPEATQGPPDAHIYKQAKRP